MWIYSFINSQSHINVSVWFLFQCKMKFFKRNKKVMVYVKKNILEEVKKLPSKI